MNHVVHKFTRKIPHWRSRVVPVRLEDATQEQLEALQVSPFNIKVSEYVLTLALALDDEGLAVRSPLFNSIMYDPGGMSCAERELGALEASMVNRCIYCAAAHADRHAKLEKDETIADSLFAKSEKADLSARDRAIFDIALKLAEAPPAAGPEDMEALRHAGFTDEEILYLILYSALFGCDNRLMHFLGDPVRQKDQK